MKLLDAGQPQGHTLPVITNVIVHPAVDLDAVTCVALAGDDTEVHFIPAGATEIPKTCPCCGMTLNGAIRVLDHQLGEKGRLDPDGKRHAAAPSMPEAAQADPRLLLEVDEQDSTGIVKQPRFSLPEILAAIKSAGSSIGLKGKQLDEYAIRMMVPMIKGINLRYAGRKKAAAYAATMPKHLIGRPSFGFVVAVKQGGAAADDGGAVDAVDSLLNETGVACAIYSQGLNLGIYRFPGRETPDLRLLKDHLPGWFVHTSGFMASWGSRKSPATAKPTAGTPQTAEELVALIKTVYQ